MTRVDLPEPDTPVTQIILPSGKSTVMSCRLFSCALTMRRNFPLPGRRASGTSTYLRPERYAPVILRLTLQISATLPAATISPPWTPHRGRHPQYNPPGASYPRHAPPRSGCCQVAQTLHRGDQLIIVTLVQADARLIQHIQHTGQALPIWVARRMRWLSPPDRDAAPRESVR